MSDEDSELAQVVRDLAAAQSGVSESLERIVEMLVRMAKVRRLLAGLAGGALAAVLLVAGVQLALVIATNRSSTAANQSAADAAHAARDAASAAKSSQSLLDTVNALLDPKGPVQAASAASVADRNNQLYCVVLIANGATDLGPTCADTRSLLQGRGVLTPAGAP